MFTLYKEQILGYEIGQQRIAQTAGPAEELFTFELQSVSQHESVLS